MVSLYLIFSTGAITAAVPVPKTSISLLSLKASNTSSMVIGLSITLYPRSFNKTIRLSSFFHLLSATSLILFVYLVFSEFNQVGIITLMAAAIFLTLLLYQHLIIKPNDLSKVNMAFFTTNGIASLIFGVLFIVDLVL